MIEPVNLDLDKLLIVEDRDTDYLPKELVGCPNIARCLRGDKSAIALLKSKKPHVIILDMKFPEFANKVPEFLAPTFLFELERLTNPDVPQVILVSAYDDIPSDLEDQLDKYFGSIIIALVSKQSLSWCQRNLYLHVSRALELWNITQAQYGGMAGSSPSIMALKRTISNVARFPVSVLIQGETGSGKELVAHAIHASSLRRNAPYLTVNCAAIPVTLVDSDLFGHKKGSFSGAIEDRDGMFKAASGGTIFLDEIGEFDLPVQAKLLRAIEDGYVKRIGENIETKVDVRVICATNRDLMTMVNDGTFREDLYYRLNGYKIDVAPLRSHSEDIPELAHLFLAASVQRQRDAESDYGLPPESYPLTFTEEALAALKQYQWPGNVRELRHTIYKALIACYSADGIREREIDCKHLPKHIAHAQPLIPEDNSELINLLRSELKILEGILNKSKRSGMPGGGATTVAPTWLALDSKEQIEQCILVRPEDKPFLTAVVEAIKGRDKKTPADIHVLKALLALDLHPEKRLKQSVFGKICTWRSSGAASQIGDQLVFAFKSLTEAASWPDNPVRVTEGSNVEEGCSQVLVFKCQFAEAQSYCTLTVHMDTNGKKQEFSLSFQS